LAPDGLAQSPGTDFHPQDMLAGQQGDQGTASAISLASCRQPLPQGSRGDERSIGPRGIRGDLESLLFPITHGVLWYTGIEVLDLHAVYDADALNSTQVDHEVKRLRERLDSLDTETPHRFRALRNGDYRGTRALHADILPGRTDLGIHCAG